MFPFASFAQLVPWITGAAFAVSAISSIQQGRAARAAARFNAEVARQNAEIARKQTQIQLRQADRERYLRLGKIRAAQGAAGGRMEGSVLDVLADTAAQSELERQDIAMRGAAAERGYLNTATLEEFSGRTALQQGYLQAGADLLGGAVSVYDQSQRLQRTR